MQQNSRADSSTRRRFGNMAPGNPILPARPGAPLMGALAAGADFRTVVSKPELREARIESGSEAIITGRE